MNFDLFSHFHIPHWIISFTALIYYFSYWSVHSFTYAFIASFVHSWVFDSHSDLFVRLLMHSLIYWFSYCQAIIHLLFPILICSCIHLDSENTLGFVCSFTHTFIHLLILTFFCSFTNALMPLLITTLIYSSVHSWVHSFGDFHTDLIKSCIHSFIISPIDLFVYSHFDSHAGFCLFIHSCIHSIIDSHIDSLVHSLIHSFFYWFQDWFIHSFTLIHFHTDLMKSCINSYWFVRLFTSALTHAFIH